MRHPRAQDRLDEIGALIAEVCREHLTDEYTALAQAAAAICAQHPDQTLLRGKAEGWACGLVRAVGYVNFLSDPASEPYLRLDDLAPLFGVSKATAANRDRDVRALLDLVRMDPHWTLPSRLIDNPMAWYLLLRGMPVDARDLPREAQEELAERGMIPFVPADPRATPAAPRWPESAASEHDLIGPDSLDPGAPRLRLTVTLDEVEPEVSRVIEVPSDLPLDGLHEVISAAMGWGGHHLHLFDAKGKTWGPAFERGLDWDDERDVTVAEVLRRKGSRLTYTYDLGDNWAHTVRRGETLPPLEGGPIFACTGGAGACPPDDCGGPWAYADLLQVLGDPSHPEHAEMLDWDGGPIDPVAFRVEEAQRRLGGA
jgi:hypothetical protein